MYMKVEGKLEYVEGLAEMEGGFLVQDFALAR